MDVRRSVKDAAYIAVGVGVIGYQQTQVRRRDVQLRITAQARETSACAQSRLRQARDTVDEGATVAVERWGGLRDGVQDRVGGIRDDVRDAVEPVVSDVKVRIEPVVEQLQALPEQVGKAVTTGAERARAAVGA